VVAVPVPSSVLADRPGLLIIADKSDDRGYVSNE
jgi:hypothetical protein